VSDEITHGVTLSVRVPPRLARALQELADGESNGTSAVVRRILSTALLRAEQRDDKAAREGVSEP